MTRNDENPPPGGRDHLGGGGAGVAAVDTAVHPGARASSQRIDIVVPTLNAAQTLAAALECVRQGCAPCILGHMVVVDGGSTDGTRDIAKACGAELIEEAPGRGAQLAAGARWLDMQARPAEWRLFVHADTCLEAGWGAAAVAHVTKQAHRAAAFRFALDDDSAGARRLEAMVRLRCAMFRLPYGDQGMLISTALYRALGGYQDMPLFEDVDLVRRLGRGRLRMLDARAVTSAERFQAEGYLARSVRNLWLLARYFSGVNVHSLAREYQRR